MGLTSLHDFYASWHLYICRSLFGHSTFFCRFTRVHDLLFMFCYEEEFQVELSRQIVLWQIFISHRSAWFPLLTLLSACRLAEFDTVVICHVFMHCLGSFLLQDMLLNHQEFAFEGQNVKQTVNILLTCSQHYVAGNLRGQRLKSTGL